MIEGPFREQHTAGMNIFAQRLSIAEVLLEDVVPLAKWFAQSTRKAMRAPIPTNSP